MKIQYGKSLDTLLYGYNTLFKTEYTLSQANIQILKRIIAECIKYFYGEIEQANEAICLATVSKIFYSLGKNSSSLDLSKVKNISYFILSAVKTKENNTDIEAELSSIEKTPTFFAIHSIVATKEEMYDTVKKTSNTLYNKLNVVERSLVLQPSSLKDSEYRELCADTEFLFITNPFASFQNKREFEKIYTLLSLRKTANKFTYLMLLEDKKFDLVYLFNSVYQYYKPFDENNYFYDILIRTIGSFSEL